MGTYYPVGAGANKEAVSFGDHRLSRYACGPFTSESANASELSRSNGRIIEPDCFPNDRVADYYSVAARTEVSPDGVPDGRVFNLAENVDVQIGASHCADAPWMVGSGNL